MTGQKNHPKGYFPKKKKKKHIIGDEEDKSEEEPLVPALSQKGKEKVMSLDESEEDTEDIDAKLELQQSGLVTQP